MVHWTFRYFITCRIWLVSKPFNLSIKGNQCWLAKEYMLCKYNHQPQGNKLIPLESLPKYFKNTSWRFKEDGETGKVLKGFSVPNSILSNFSGFTISI